MCELFGTAMAGTDKTRNQTLGPAPIVVLVNPQLGENIGTAARAMANFGLHALRLVEPRDGWPSEKALTASSGARWHGIPHVLLLRSRADPKRRIVVMGGFPPKVSLSSGSGQVIMFDGRTPP